MRNDFIERRRDAALAVWRFSRAFGRTGAEIIGWVLIALLWIAAAVVFLLATGHRPAHAQDHTAYVARTDAQGVCTFDVSLAGNGTAQALCLTGLLPSVPIAAQVETNSIAIDATLVSVTGSVVDVLLRNLAPYAVGVPGVRVRLAHVVPVGAHPCTLPPPPEPWTLRDRCVQAACAAGLEPSHCLIKRTPETGAAGTAIPAAN